MKSMHYIALILVIIGGLNWGLIGLGSFMGGADWNVVHMILGSWSMVENIVYVLVGLSALNIAYTHKKNCRMCNASGTM